MSEHKEYLAYSDIMISPQYSTVPSRADSRLDMSAQLHSLLTIKLPVISANMRHITGPKMAIEMARQGGLGILHRDNTIEGAIEDYMEVVTQEVKCGVSVGVQEPDKERFDKLYEAGARIFAIDLAHAHSLNCKKMTEWVRGTGLKDIVLIVGNIATPEAALDLQEWGADVLKCGIGPGSACMTRRNVGVGVPQFSALQEIAEVARIPIIADGGIVYSGDVAKALIYADAVMVGGFIAGTSETPGKVYRNEYDKFYKVYGGSASGENKHANGKKVEFVEGVMKTVEFRGHVKYLLRAIDEGIRSAFSYSGAWTLPEYHAKVEWIRISDGGRIESKI
jgi:IMP dehydrogenase